MSGVRVTRWSQVVVVGTVGVRDRVFQFRRCCCCCWIRVGQRLHSLGLSIRFGVGKNARSVPRMAWQKTSHRSAKPRSEYKSGPGMQFFGLG
eukprot:2636374-Rhodomonas_salina.6